MGIADWWQQQQRHEGDVVAAKPRGRSERRHAHVHPRVFERALAARFFSKSAAPPDALLKAEKRAGGSRLRALFARSNAPSTATAAAPVTVLEIAHPQWLESDAMIEWENQVTAVASSGSADFRLTSDGCGGVYFLQAESSLLKKTAPLGVFKPRDEEYMAPKNPRGYVKENAVVGETDHPVNKGFRIGNGALRERAAFVLDEAYGSFSGVPVTSVMTLELRGEKTEGSMQRFVVSECSAEDMGTLKFAIPEVHKIGILDVRLFNTDRHAGNILLSSRSEEQTYGMTPIDHGFCLPSYKHLDSATFDWLQWPQAQFPFTGAELDHIASLDVARDAGMLRALGIEEECITTMRLSTTLLKIGADSGFSLYEIANCLQREGDFSTPSIFENLVANAAAAVEGFSNVDGLEFYDALVAEVERAATVLFAALPKKKVRSISCFS